MNPLSHATLTNATERRQARVGWWFTAVAVTPCFSYILAMSLAPRAMARPISSTSLVTYGLALGLALAVFLVVIALIYTRRVNRLERDEAQRR
jgi:uncharacterized membrane protein (DUF485 family)